MKNEGYLTAQQSQFLQCRLCGKALEMTQVELDHCPRCHIAVYARLPYSIARTWALLIASMLFYIPANVLPILTVERFGVGKPDTILSGIEHLMHSGLLFIAAIVFIASILVPLLKIVALVLLLLTIQCGWSGDLRLLTRLYRLIEFIGRWSMLDIFVIMIIVALVKFGNIAAIEVGPAAPAFAAVVILTMFASRSFDARLIWDKLENHD